ncbi:hypothetical protein F4777DRAFT_559802 [Nemania sp. FL0916]|nr:hypothetical protein F4777DRAFT_559802 [Nemania sp. FL0916]
MRLVFVSSDQEVIEIEAALETDASLIRGLLSNTLFDAVRARFPDTIDMLLAERSIRDALSLFTGENERRVSNYILTRSLDPRVNSPRTQIIHQSFEVGGPVAVAGVFYATIDSHRNVQNRETLNFLARLDEPTRLDLFRRAGNFPCHPLLGPWLVRLLEKLDIDTKDLARLFLCLGRSTIPLVLFERARSPSRSWGEDGEVTDTPSGAMLLIKNEERFSKALRELVDIGFVSLRDAGIYVRASFLNLLEAWSHSVQMREEAVRVVSHSFPKHKVHYGKGYTDLCLNLIPVLRHSMTYLPGIPLSQAGMYQAAEACLSASRFLIEDESWREQIMSAAQYLAERSTSPILSARVVLRRLAIERMHGSQEPISVVPFPQNDRRSRAFSVEAVCLQAQRYMDLGLFASAQNELAGRVITLDSCSSFERVQQQKIMYMRAKTYRLEREFTIARTLLVDLIETESHLAEKAAIHLSAVDCELGHAERAITNLGAYLQQDKCCTITRGRVELALAHAQLMQALLWVKDQRLSWFSHPSLRDSYLKCQAGLPTSGPKISTNFTRTSIVAALAILAHLRGDFDTALAEWNRTLELAQGLGLVGNYIELVVAYSTNDIYSRRGGVAAEELETKVRVLSARTGRQYHFLGLGTTWPDILGGWQEDRGRDRLISDTLFPSG